MTRQLASGFNSIIPANDCNSPIMRATQATDLIGQKFRVVFYEETPGVYQEKITTEAAIIRIVPDRSSDGVVKEGHLQWEGTFSRVISNLPPKPGTPLPVWCVAFEPEREFKNGNGKSIQYLPKPKATPTASGSNLSIPQPAQKKIVIPDVVFFRQNDGRWIGRQVSARDGFTEVFVADPQSVPQGSSGIRLKGDPRQMVVKTVQVVRELDSSTKNARWYLVQPINTMSMAAAS